MEFCAEKAFFKADTIDAVANLPVYVLDTTFLPNISRTSYDKGTQDQLILKAFKRIIQRIPMHPYVLIVFTSGFKNLGKQSNSWVTMLKCYQLLPDELKTNLRKAYIIHESWLVRSFTRIITNVLHIKPFKNSPIQNDSLDRLVYCRDLTDLSKHIDITKIRISLEVYLYDLEFTERLTLPYSGRPNTKAYSDYKDLILERTMTRLLVEAPVEELVFTRPGNQKKLMILIDAIDRMNYLDLSQWDIHVMGTLFLNIIRTHEVQLIPIDLITLPIQNNLDYTLRIFKEIIAANDSFQIISKIMDILLSLLDNAEQTKHDLKSICKSMTPSLCQEKVSIKNNDRLIIGQAFLKNLLEYWDQITRELNSKKKFKSLSSAAPSSDSKSESSSTASISTSTSKSLPSSSLASDSSVSSIPEPPASRKISYTNQPILMTKREARSLPEVPHESSRNLSASSKLSIDSNSSSCSSTTTTFESHKLRTISTQKENFNVNQSKSVPMDDPGAKVLSDVTSNLNKLSKVGLMKSPEKKKVITKFSEGYSSIEGKQKVNKLAQLYEERLQGLKILEELESSRRH